MKQNRNEEKSGRAKGKSQTALWKRKATPWLFLLPSLIGVSIFYVIPFMDVVRRSFMSAMGNEFAGIDNYRTVVENSAFQTAAGNTARFLTVCIPILLVVSMAMALLVFSQKRGRGVWKSVYLLPMAVPVAAIVLVWKIIFDRRGLLNAVGSLLGMGEIDFINSDAVFWVLIFTYVWKNFGYNMVLWMSGMENIDTSLYEAASVDGAGGVQKFRYITLPQLKPLIATVTLLSVLNAFKVFREAYLIAGSYPQKSIYLLQHIFNNWFVNLDMGKICAGAVMVTAVIAVLVMLLQRDGGKEKPMKRKNHRQGRLEIEKTG